MFLTETDLNVKINADLRNKITAEDDTITNAALKLADDTLINLLGERYNMTTELGKTGDTRNGTLLDYALNLAVFRIYERMPDMDVPERVVKLYDDTLEDLSKINQGKMSLSSLTKMVDDDGEKKTRFNWGSTDKRENNPF